MSIEVIVKAFKEITPGIDRYIYLEGTDTWLSKSVRKTPADKAKEEQIYEQWFYFKAGFESGLTFRGEQDGND